LASQKIALWHYGCSVEEEKNNEITSRVNAEISLHALDSEILQLNVHHLALARIPSWQKKTTIQRGLLFDVDVD
jgi:hypothetical protein